MATLYYSLMGEGRGHAARARAMTERLRQRHRVVLFTSHDALEFLKGEYDADPEIEVRAIPGIKFHYRGQRLDYAKSIRLGLSFGASLGGQARRLAEEFQADPPDLVITDFEPLVPRAVRRLGVPVLSLDHQHFLSTYDLSSLPDDLQRWAWRMSWAVWAFGIRAERTVVSAFYKPPLRPGFEHVTQVGPLLRPAISQRTAHRGEHVLSYLRRATPDRVLRLLAELPLPVRVYGLGERPAMGGVTFRPIDEDAFLDDLSSCDSVISAAGNQLLGEALHFGKPIFAMPETNHHEQRINACFLAESGGGDWRLLERVTAEDLSGFLDRREEYRTRLADSGKSYDGAAEAAAAIESLLGSHQPAPTADACVAAGR